MINSSISLEDLNNIFSVARNDLQLIEDLTAAGNDERAAFNTLREHSHAISALISALLGEGREVEDEVVEDVESDEDVARESPADKAARVTARRMNGILLAVSEVALGPSDFVDLLRTRIGGQKMEDSGFMRLMRGYSSLDIASWTETLSSYVGDVGALEDTAIDLNESDNVVDITERLNRRACFLDRHQTSCDGQAYVHLLVRQTEAIKFAGDWRAKGLEVGGKSYKSAFHKSLYELKTGTTVEIANSSTEGAKDFKQFLSRQKRLIVSRSYLRDMYREFGAAVLLDPVWDIDHISACSKTFRLLFQNLRLCRTAMSIEKRQSNVLVLKAVGDILSNGRLNVYIERFTSLYGGGLGYVSPAD